jgi:hypothetical protein
MEYGTPMGKFENSANSLLCTIFLNAKLCVISWIARNKFWFAVLQKIMQGKTRVGYIALLFLFVGVFGGSYPPITYAVRKNFQLHADSL